MSTSSNVNFGIILTQSDYTTVHQGIWTKTSLLICAYILQINEVIHCRICCPLLHHKQKPHIVFHTKVSHYSISPKFQHLIFEKLKHLSLLQKLIKCLTKFLKTIMNHKHHISQSFTVNSMGDKQGQTGTLTSEYRAPGMTRWSNPQNELAAITAPLDIINFPLNSSTLVAIKIKSEGQSQLQHCWELQSPTKSYWSVTVLGL